MSSVGTPFRRTRTVVIATVIVGLAAIAHVLGGGKLPDTGALLALAALITLPVAVLTARKLSTTAMAATLGAGQLFLHRAFMQLEPMPAESMGMHTQGADGANSHVMLVAHAFATVATAVVLAKNETILFSLIAWLRPLFQAPEHQSRPATSLMRPTLATQYVPALRDNTVIHPLRGPPVLGHYSV